MFHASGKKEERTAYPCFCNIPPTFERFSRDQRLAYVTISARHGTGNIR